jgi:hypothetical protein
MRRTIITILSTALVVAGSAAIVQAAGGPEREVAASSSAPAEPKGTLDRRAPAHAAVRCRNLGCINRKLTKLNRDAFKCERLVNLTQYQGYLYTPDGTNVIETTALDYTQSGDAPSDQFVIYVC